MGRKVISAGDLVVGVTGADVVVVENIRRSRKAPTCLCFAGATDCRGAVAEDHLFDTTGQRNGAGDQNRRQGSRRDGVDVLITVVMLEGVRIQRYEKSGDEAHVPRFSSRAWRSISSSAILHKQADRSIMASLKFQESSKRSLYGT